MVTITDDFESLADGDPLSDDTDWSVYQASGSGVPTMDQHDDHTGGTQVVDMSTTGDSYSVHQTQVGNDDHYAEADVFPDRGATHGNHVGPLVRGSSATPGTSWDGYGAFAYGDPNSGNEDWFLGIFRIDNGVPTELASTVDLAGQLTTTTTNTLRLEVEGSTLTAFVNGTQELQTTDATYSSGQYTGFRLYREEASVSSQPFVDNFEAVDISSGLTVNPPLLDATGTVFNPSVSTGAVTVSPPLLDATATAFNPSVDTSTTVTVPLLDATAVTFNPTVNVGAVTVSPPLLDATATLFNPSVATDATVVQVPLLDATGTVFAPTVTPGAVTISVPLLDATGSLFNPTVTSGLVVAPPLIDATATLFAPSVTTGPVTVSPPLLDATGSVFAPSVTPTVTVTVPLLDATGNLFNPTVTVGAVTITVPLLDGTATLFAPSVSVPGLVPPGGETRTATVAAESRTATIELEVRTATVDLDPTETSPAFLLSDTLTDSFDTTDVTTQRVALVPA